MTKSEFGHSVMISNEEFSVLQKIKARGKVKADSISEYYQEIADRLVSRGVLNKDEDGDEEYYTPIRSTK